MKLLIFSLPLLFCFCTPTARDTSPVAQETTTPLQASMTTTATPGYFKAKGASPEWDLQISGEQISFTSALPGFERFNSPHVEPAKAMDSNVKQYQVHTESGMMNIQIMQGSCQVTGSREGFSYKVEVQIKFGTDTTFTSFTGCGVYVTDYRLQDIWVLEEIKGKKIREEDIAGERPRLEIKANTNAFSGFAGCNTMSGRIFSERNLLRFTDFVLTKVTCDAMPMELEFINTLKFSTEFKIEDNRLILSNPGQVTLVFRKTD